MTKRQVATDKNVAPKEVNLSANKSGKTFFVPEFGVSVKASNASEAFETAKKSLGKDKEQE